VQVVAGGEVFLDVPPWAPGATAIPMVAVDGSFNQTIENARADIATGSLSVGRHTLYVRGRDALGNVGPVSAIFFQVTSAANQAPGVQIARPTKGTVVVAGNPLTLAASAVDPEDGDLSGILIWTSSISGQLLVGAGGDVMLPGGTHIITATVQDSEGVASSANVTVNVGIISGGPTASK
jgi:carboxypeptidase T